MTKRKTGLDLLRGLAIMLVLFRHSDLQNNLLVHFGWLGVDLFFVLSGFLVSGLLFKEYQTNHRIQWSRFLFRRSFKIFPPFYVFVIFTIAFDYFFLDLEHAKMRLLAEVFYYRNYYAGLWGHTWSLNVEEHFYLLLVLALFLGLRLKLLTNRKVVISFLVSLLILSFAIRWYVSNPSGVNFFFKTHMRADGIVWGVLLSYLFHFTSALGLLRYRKWWVFALSLVLIMPGLVYEGGSFEMSTFGLSLVNMGFAMWVWLAMELEDQLTQRPRLNWVIKPIAFIGVNSYSIYLWHLNAYRIVDTDWELTLWQSTCYYFALAILLGTLMSYLVEKNALKIRAAFWPDHG